MSDSLYELPEGFPAWRANQGNLDNEVVAQRALVAKAIKDNLPPTVTSGLMATLAKLEHTNQILTIRNNQVIGVGALIRFAQSMVEVVKKRIRAVLPEHEASILISQIGDDLAHMADTLKNTPAETRKLTIRER